MPSIPDVTAKALAADVPVLFLDTCSILDVIRAHARKQPLQCVESAMQILSLATSTPPECSLVVGSFVPTEWAEHEGAVHDLLRGHLEDLDVQAAKIHQLCGQLGVSLGFPQPQYQPSAVATKLRELSHDLLRASFILDGELDTGSRAYNRVAVAKKRPSRKGGELRDCTIFEECLEVCRQLQAGGFSRKMVYCSSNTDDYCSPGIVPHPDIASDCGAVNLVFTTTLPWALNELRGP